MAAKGSTFVGLLDLNPGSVVSINGQPIIIRRDDFVGIKDIVAAPTSGADTIHFVTVRAAATKSKSADATTDKAPPAGPHDAKLASEFSTTVGFFFRTSDPDAIRTGQNTSFIRRYDPYTEEVSGDAVDEQTGLNLANRVQNNQIELQRVLAYPAMATQPQQWSERTQFITRKVLDNRGIQSGVKLVPGAYHVAGDDDEATTKQQPEPIKDGISPQYPCIPVWNVKTKFRVKRHMGTQRYLAQLEPAQRTILLRDPNPACQLLHDILKRYYSNTWQYLLGDLQLAFVLFLNLRCFASLEHWRDLISMLSFVEPAGLIQNSALYDNLLQILSKQVLAIENEFFEDLEMSSGNFLLVAFEALMENLSSVSLSPIALANFQSILKNKFPTTFGSDGVYEVNDDGEFDILNHEDEFDDDDSEDEDNDADMIRRKRRGENMDDGDGNKAMGKSSDDGSEDDDDDDAPVVVSMHEVEAAMERNRQNDSHRQTTTDAAKVQQQQQGRSEPSGEMKKAYPFLFAAVMPHEDVLMTCARVLDAKTDVSLVREAAAYLEQVEVGSDMSSGGAITMEQ